MSRFVLLRHECPTSYEKSSHWDFMLEHEGVLRTWELRELPTSWAHALSVPESTDVESVPAIALPDHRLAYLDFEGPLSGNRGSVRRCDGGDYRLLREDRSSVEFELFGTVLRERGRLSLVDQAWRLVVGFEETF